MKNNCGASTALMSNSNTNLYQEMDGSPMLRPSVTAFIDILGYKHQIQKSIKSGEAALELRRLRSALDEGLEQLKRHSQDKMFGDVLGFQLRTFTDNILIGYPVHDRVGLMGPIHMVQDFVGFLQAKMAQLGYFLRGAIAVGDLYVDEDLVFGPALLEAYEAETSKAQFPRVILCDSAKQALESDPGPIKGSEFHGFLIDPDGAVFVDYLYSAVMIAYPDDRPFTEFLEGHRVAVTANLQAFSDNPKLFAKYQWAAIYHNAFCDRYPDEFGDDDKVSVPLLPGAPTPWIPKPD